MTFECESDLFKMADGLRSIRVHDEHVFAVEDRVRQLPEAEVSEVSAFTGDGKHAGDGGWMLQRLWDAGGGQWSDDLAPLDLGGRGGGCYILAATSAPPQPTSQACLSSEGFTEVLARIGWPKSMVASSVVLPLSDGTKASATLAAFPDGGALATQEDREGSLQYRHFLLTRSALQALRERNN
jgi:hypothetical protein